MVAQCCWGSLKMKNNIVSDGGRKPSVRYPRGYWTCPKCGIKISFLVDMTSPPACHNHKGGAVYVMEKLK